MSGLVTEFIEAILVDWYRTAAAWAPPGNLTSRGCELCGVSPLPARLGLAEWPHDVTHPLVRDLTEAEQSLGQMLEDAGQPVTVELAAGWMRTTVDSHAGDIRDILRQCVEPRFDEYVRQQAGRAVKLFDLLHSEIED
jgi:hypothetical protein